MIPILEQFNTAEDLVKFFGIAFWLVFFYRAAFHEVTISTASTKG
jgi:hypothetical protein